VVHTLECTFVILASLMSEVSVVNVDQNIDLGL
jgi:hypothetical protein